MKMNKETVDARRKEILKQIQLHQKASVDSLAKQLNVSCLTIRRDLQYWEDQGAVQRYYGGARLVQSFLNNDDLKDNNEPYKHAIAKYAAQFVEDGDTIFINTSSTSLLILKYIHNKRVTVITNNGKAIYIDHDPLISVVLTGGELRIPKESMVGDFAINNLNCVSANKTFLGCSGFDLENGMTTAILPEVSINSTMVQRCQGPLFVLADATKIGNTHQFTVTNIQAFDYLITDNRADKELLNEFEKVGIKTVSLNPFYGYQNK